MEYEFKCDFTPEEATIGKIILYRQGNGIHLNGNMQVNEGHTKHALEAEGSDFLLEHLRRLYGRGTTWLGLHKEIPHNGAVLGGAVAAFVENTLYVDATSGDYGSISGEAVKRCLEDRGIDVVCGEDVSKQALDDYLMREGK